MGDRNAGINVRTVCPDRSVHLQELDHILRLQGLISNILEEDVVQPLLVSTSALELATETVCLLLKIDDYVQAR
jgi:T-complex protein 1 subunit delta